MGCIASVRHRSCYLGTTTSVATMQSRPSRSVSEHKRLATPPVERDTDAKEATESRECMDHTQGCGSPRVRRAIAQKTARWMLSTAERIVMLCSQYVFHVLQLRNRHRSWRFLVFVRVCVCAAGQKIPSTKCSAHTKTRRARVCCHKKVAIFGRPCVRRRQVWGQWWACLSLHASLLALLHGLVLTGANETVSTTLHHVGSWRYPRVSPRSCTQADTENCCGGWAPSTFGVGSRNDITADGNFRYLGIHPSFDS